MTALADYVPQPPEWMQEAVCTQVDADLWFPDKGGSSRPAKNICRACPVQAECLEHALEAHELFGIWGGVSERDRRKLARIALPTDTGDAA